MFSTISYSGGWSEFYIVLQQWKVFYYSTNLKLCIENTILVTPIIQALTGQMLQVSFLLNILNFMKGGHVKRRITNGWVFKKAILQVYFNTGCFFLFFFKLGAFFIRGWGENGLLWNGVCILRGALSLLKSLGVILFTHTKNYR